MRAVAARLLDRSRRMKEAESRQRETAANSPGGGCSGASSPDVTTNTARPHPPRCPPCPKNASLKDLRKWDMECRRIGKLYAQDPLAKLLDNLPTQRKPPNQATTVCFSAANLGGCNGAPVIDHDGNVIGMSFSGRPTKLVSISTILTYIEMWMKFRRIARPIIHGLSLRSSELLDVSSREEISYSYNIDSGYIVDVAQFDSTAEKVGIRRGDVIVSFDELGVHSLPKLEDLLLSVGWEFLERGLDASTVLEVYDPIGHCTRSIILPVGFCDAKVDECE